MQNTPASIGGFRRVSSCLDNYKNQVDRYEGDAGPDCAPEVRIVVTLNPDAGMTQSEVEAWYWRDIGTFAFEPRDENERREGY